MSVMLGGSKIRLERHDLQIPEYVAQVRLPTDAAASERLTAKLVKCKHQAMTRWVQKT